MQLQKALIGGIAGGVVGIALLVVAYMFFGIEGSWTAIVVALAVGLGVRALVATKGHASYVRGALIGLLAIVAFVGARLLTAEIAARQYTEGARTPAEFSAEPRVAMPEQTAQSDDADPAAATTDDAMEQGADSQSDAVSSAPMELKVREGGSQSGVERRVGRDPREYTVLDFILLCVAAFIAYELGRGAGSTPPKIVSEPAAEPAAPTA